MSYHLANTRPVECCTLCDERTEGRVWGQALCGIHAWMLLEAMAGGEQSNEIAHAWVDSMRLRQREAP